VLPRFDSPACFAALLIPRVGFLPYDDERVVGTIEAMSEELTRTVWSCALLSEEYDAHAKRLVGNMPQGLNHLVIVNCARRLSATAGQRSRALSGVVETPSAKVRLQ
jgi:GH15 family glucan-1,4-alpha-glucosidase